MQKGTPTFRSYFFSTIHQLTKNSPRNDIKKQNSDEIKLRHQRSYEIDDTKFIIRYFEIKY